MATAGAPIGAGARWWGVVSSFLECSALAGGEKSGTEFDQSVAAHPAGRPVGQQAARKAAAQSPQGEVVAEVPSTPRRYCKQFNLESRVSHLNLSNSQSRRSDSGFSGGGGGGSRSSGRSRGDQSHQNQVETYISFLFLFNHFKVGLIWREKMIIMTVSSIQSMLKLFLQSKALSSSGRSSRREGGRHRGKRGGESHHHGPSSLPPPPCECVCTCGDPVPPKPVRRVMFSDESCSCSDDEKMKSLPVHMSSDSSARGVGRGGGGSASERLCCGPPSLPSRGQSARSLKEEVGREVQVKEEEMMRNEEESSGCCSASPVPSHYKSPKEVDGDYSYAYR